MNFRISNNLFESIRNVTNPQVEEPAKVEEAEVDKAHFCATHVEHAMLGLGTCISEQHAEPDDQGQISWYTVEFPTGTHRIQTSNLRIVEGKSHSHSKKMAEAEENIEEKKLHPNQQVLDVHEPEKDELTADDFKKLRAGKTQKTVKEEQIDELSVNTLNRVHRAAVSDANDASRDGDEARADKRYNLAGKASNKAELKNRAAGLKPSGQHSMGEGHAGTVTMKQVDKSDATPQVKAAIKKSAPDIKSYADRAAALTAAGIKREAVEQIDEIGDTPAGMEKVKAYRAAVGRQYHKTGEYDTRLSDTDRKPNPFHAKDAANMPNAANKRYSRQTGAARAKKIEMGTRYEEANFALEEGISETIVKHNDFTIEITDNPTYGDFLRAVQSIVRTDEESMQQEIVAIAEEAYAENYEDVIIESFTRMEIEDKLAAHRKAGNTVSNDKFSTKNGEPYAEYVVTDKEGGRKKYIHHGSVRRMESMPGKTAKSSKEE